MERDIKELSKTETTDNYIISTCIALLSGYFIMFSIAKPTNIFVCYSVTIAIFCLFVTLFAFIWHKIRWKQRMEQFIDEKNKIIKKSAKEIHDGLKDFFNPRLEAKLLRHIMAESFKSGKHPKEIDPRQFATKESADNIFKEVVKEDDKPLFDHICNYTKNLSYELQYAHETFLKKPLNEKYSSLKFYVDMFTHKARYHFFTIGIIFCFISIVLHLYQ